MGKHLFNACLCCGQTHRGYTNPLPVPEEKLKASFALLEAIGYTREKLLADHVEQLDFQLPGMREWLERQ